VGWRPLLPAWWRTLLPMMLWIALLAALPWWLGLPLLCALTATLLLLRHRLADVHAPLIRRGLRWGLPGVMFAVQRALGGDALAWVVALFGVLAGYTLLAGLEAWLDRDLRRVPAVAAATDWSELAMAPIGPAAEIIALQLPVWQSLAGDFDDPRGGRVNHRDGSYRFADGTCIDKVGPCAGFSPAARWFVARMDNNDGVVLHDRERNTLNRLHGWQLDGWYREQPWLVRHEGDMPLALRAVLGQDEMGD
jgi:hypothetical protein